MSGSGREALGNLREWSGSLFGCPEVVGNPSGMSGFGWKAIPDVREWSGGHPGCSAVVGNSFLDVRERS